MASSNVANAHTAIVDPGSRGDNFGKNGTLTESDGQGMAISEDGSDPIFPYGMTFMYPCKSSAQFQHYLARSH